MTTNGYPPANSIVRINGNRYIVGETAADKQISMLHQLNDFGWFGWTEKVSVVWPDAVYTVERHGPAPEVKP